MGDKSAIEWTEATWNPIVGCSRVSEGCRHCYAERQAYRAEAMGIPQYEGMTHKVGSEIRWTGKVALVEHALELPLKWKKPRRIFVNSMSDLFHEKTSAEWVERIFDVMRRAKQHAFQVLTKRPERMHRLLGGELPAKVRVGDPATVSRIWRMQPLPNVWLGVSVEDQVTADERIPLLLQTPAAVRWVSYEPALGAVDFSRWLPIETIGGVEMERWIDWLVCGGESGPGARSFDLAWARQTLAQGRAAGVPVFVKQLGALPYEHNGDWPTLYRDVSPTVYFRDYDGSGVFYADALIRDRKGGDPAEWPEDLRVREYPR